MSNARRSGCALLLFVATICPARGGRLPDQQARFIGAVGCKSSSCHGGAGEKWSQFITWTRQDFHARSFAILTNARSARIAETLGVSDPANSARCTVCHAPMLAVSPVRLTSNADPREGVSCENCHGAGEPWLRGHTRTDWTYAARVGAGMRDLRSLYVRANTCVACHQNVDAQILAAGHPELTFELDSQSIAEPKHWRDPDGNGVRAWLVGQAVALRECSWQLAKNADATARDQWNALAWLLNKVSATAKDLPSIDPAETTDFARLQEQADAFARRVAQQNFSDKLASSLLADLAKLDTEFAQPNSASRDLLFHRAQRLTLGLQCLTNAAGVRAENLALLQADIHSLGDFQSEQFADHLVRFRLAAGL